MPGRLNHLVHKHTITPVIIRQQICEKNLQKITNPFSVTHSRSCVGHKWLTSPSPNHPSHLNPPSTKNPQPPTALPCRRSAAFTPLQCNPSVNVKSKSDENRTFIQAPEERHVYNKRIFLAFQLQRSGMFVCHFVGAWPVAFTAPKKRSLCHTKDRPLYSPLIITLGHNAAHRPCHLF